MTLHTEDTKSRPMIVTHDYVEEQLDRALADEQNWWSRLRCWLGLHDWDGHIEYDVRYGHRYPAPKCRRCGKWHHRDSFNKGKP